MNGTPTGMSGYYHENVAFAIFKKVVPKGQSFGFVRFVRFFKNQSLEKL
jgi:hypothetical protein